MFLQQKAGAFGNDRRKEPQKSHAQNWKICILYIYWKHLLCLQSNASGSFLQKFSNFVEQRFTFFHFEGSIIPHIFYCETSISMGSKRIVKI